MKTVILGHVCIDKNTSENSTYISAGSPAIFINKIFKQLNNCETITVAPYGKDAFKHLKKEQLNIYPQQACCKSTLVYENKTKNGIRKQKARNRQEAVPIKMDEIKINTLNAINQPPHYP